MRIRALSIAALLSSSLALAAAPARAGGVHAWVAGEGTRVRRGDVGLGQKASIVKDGRVALVALRGETVAAQVVVEGGDAGLDGVTVDVDLPGAAARLERDVECYVHVGERSRNDRHPRESLGWTPAARPADDAMLGEVPDALVPIALAPPFCPYPLRVAPHATATVWIDVDVPESAPPGRHRGGIDVRSPGGSIAHFELDLEVVDGVLPYRPVSFLAYYGPDELEKRIGALAPAEDDVWTTLHRHRVDALASIRTRADVERLRSALDGSLFSPERGYEGPGLGEAPVAVALGAYGTLGDPSDEKATALENVVAAIPAAVRDVILYAVDEQCDSPRGPNWRALVREHPRLARVRVAHTCSRDPDRQEVDLALVTADSFSAEKAAAARRRGTDVWVYNGSLPASGTLLLDAPPTSLTLDGWIAATHDVGRWFLWETTFWNDDNRGGHGPIDPFTTPVTFHDAGGDTALGDGLLLYPATQLPPFAKSSLGRPGVVPSMRLRALRRGIEDAGLLALARAAHPIEADAIAREVVPWALADANAAEPPPFVLAPARLAAARDALRRLVPRGASLGDGAAAGILREGARARPPRTHGTSRALVAAASCALALVVLGAIARYATGDRKSRGALAT